MRDDIFTQLRNEILNGTLLPGTQLKEVQLASRFGVSRTPVRDALSRLEDLGLAERVNRGLEVRGLDPEQVIQVYDMRILLEVEASGQAAQNRNLNDILTLEALLERDRSLENPTDAELIQTNLEFHRAVWKATQNPVLIDLLERLMTHLVHAPTSTLSVDDRQNEALNEHAKLIEAISDRNTAAARDIAKQHFSTAREIRMNLLRKAALRDATQ
ncbi:GntR family transcriptional regulator [Corynebacterium coyleae]|uniref:GntR family transcriptional regulator n=1 Tax=Corynebacterium coyleae TaxID=53374 RepID=A0AAP6XP87_9CORY|nr:GntR family transcriptional regulator [Corynebacterium coyleae]NJJ04552.1 GntR family transcriptional regulator [Corynebacterium coyleae]